MVIFAKIQLLYKSCSKIVFFCKNFNHEKISNHTYFDDYVDFWFRTGLVRLQRLQGRQREDYHRHVQHRQSQRHRPDHQLDTAMQGVSVEKRNQIGFPKSMSDDGCHPNADTYYIMEEMVMKAIQKAR